MNSAKGQQRAARSSGRASEISSPRMRQDACNVTSSHDSCQQFNWEGRVSGAPGSRLRSPCHLPLSHPPNRLERGNYRGVDASKFVRLLGQRIHSRGTGRGAREGGRREGRSSLRAGGRSQAANEIEGDGEREDGR